MILCFTLLFGLNIVYADDNNEFNITYEKSDERGMTVDSHITTLFRLSDTNGQKVKAYCVDRSTSIQSGASYSRTNVGNADYYSSDSANHIRAIVQNAYPYIDISELENRCGINDLTTKEAITATQLAIWHYSNDSELKCNDKNVNALFNWYLNLAPATASKVQIGSVDINAVTSKSGDGYTCVVRFKTDAVNVDGSPVKLSLNTSKDISLEYPSITRTDDGVIDGYNQVTFLNIPENASFDFIASGTQNVDFDGYFYSPYGGRKASQSLVGAYIGNTVISSSASFNPSSEDNNTIKIVKIDSVTGDTLSGAEFKISNTSDFTGTVYTVTTNDEGIALQSGLTPGKWYIREVKSPSGYITYEETFSVSVGNGITIAECKNTPYGSIQIIKSDEDDNPVQGAQFSIYKGDTVKNDSLLFADLVSDEAGVFSQDGIEPGVYTVVETKAPDGYHLNSTPVTINVKPGETATAKITDVKIKPGYINMYKKDAISGEQLAGAVIGVYSDSSLNNLIGTFTTSGNAPVRTGDIAPGTYYVKELTPPDGYLNDSKVQTVEVPEGGFVDVTFNNNPVPKTAGNFALTLIAGLTMLSGCAVLTFVFRKRLIKH